MTRRREFSNRTRLKAWERVAAKHSGAYRPRSAIPGSKGTRFKRKLDGTVVPRED